MKEKGLWGGGQICRTQMLFQEQGETTILAFSLLKLSIVIQSYAIYSSPVVL